MARGVFIVIDGADGSGKQTQWQLLLDRLVREGKTTAGFDFPQYTQTFFGKMVRQYLDGQFGPPTTINPYLASVLYAADRWQAKPAIEAALAAGKIVISNRYLESNLAIQRAKLTDSSQRETYLTWDQEMEYQIFGIPKADLVLYLAVPPAISWRLIEERVTQTGNQRDGHEARAFLEAMDISYRELAGRLGWTVIDCAPKGELLTREAIAEQIWQVVEPHLHHHKQ